MEFTEFGEALKNILKKEGKTARELSRMMGIDEGYLSRVINGKRQPTCPWMKKALDHLGYVLEIKKRGGLKTKKKK